MMEQNRFRIMIIDDNPKIHLDFIKILTINEFENQISALRKRLFTPDDSTLESTQENISIKMPIFEIETASNGEDGFKKIITGLKEGRPFALAFVDIRMPPGIDGIKTIKKIWKIDKDIQIVICTAFSDYSWEQTVKELGIGDNLLILKKPFDNNVVRQMACALTIKWEGERIDRKYIKLLENQSADTEVAIAERNPISLDGILIVSSNGIIQDTNVEFANMWGFQAANLKARNFNSVLEQMKNEMGENNSLIADAKIAVGDASKIINGEVTLNDMRTIEYYTQPYKQSNEPDGRLWSFKDITEQSNRQKQLEYQATHDSLTNIPNRFLLMDYSNYVIATAERNKTIFAVIFIDINDFKEINDTYSHEIGDELLHQFAKRIMAETRSSDMFARFGGDEFVLVAQDITDEKYVLDMIKRLNKLVSAPFKILNKTFKLTISTGISIYPKDGNTMDQLLHVADIAMYTTKINGKTN